MRRITCREAAIEGVITRHGTLVGPLMTELAGFPELTPYGGGWCGNDVHGSLFSRRRARGGPRPHHADGRAAAQGGLSRLLRARLPGRRGHRRDVPGRDEPAGHRRQLDDQRHRRCLRRHAAVPVPPARVHGRRLRDRRRRAQRALGAPAEHRRLVAVHPQGDRRAGGDADRRAAVGDLADADQRRRSASRAATPTGTRSPTRTTPSTCASPTRATTATRAPTSASWSPAAT